MSRNLSRSPPSAAKRKSGVSGKTGTPRLYGLEQGPAGAISQFETFHNINLAATPGGLAGAHQNCREQTRHALSVADQGLARREGRREVDAPGANLIERQESNQSLPPPFVGAGFKPALCAAHTGPFVGATHASPCVHAVVRRERGEACGAPQKTLAFLGPRPRPYEGKSMGGQDARSPPFTRPRNIARAVQHAGTTTRDRVGERVSGGTRLTRPAA